MKKKLSSHDDTPSTPLPPKTIEVGEVNAEGDVKGTKYSVDENHTTDKSGTQTRVKNEKNPDYWLPAEEIDKYAVDTRIWDRIGEMGGGDGGGPHTHDNYADKTHGHDDLSPKSHLHPEYSGVAHTHDTTHNHDGDYADAQTLADHLANHPEGGGSGEGYDDSELRGRVETNETDIDALEVENNSQNLNIQANTDALAGKADADHTHDTTHNHDGTYQPAGDYALNSHTHPDPDLSGYVKGETGTGMALWIGTQEEYDAVISKRLTTLYVVM